MFASYIFSSPISNILFFLLTMLPTSISISTMKSSIFDNFFLLICYSIKHEYGAWDDTNPTAQTCNANIKITPGSHTPQEVAPDAYVVFSYDVTFEVYSSFLKDCDKDCCSQILINFELTYCRLVRSYGHLAGMSTFFLAIAKSIGSQLLIH